MTDTVLHQDDARSAMKAEIERLRAAGVAGDAGRLRDLFDYLARQSLEGVSPKEIEIAADVFGRSDLSETGDSSVRVYVHRLRKRLEDHYLKDGAASVARLTLPRGEYRFALEGEAEATRPPAAAGGERRLKLSPGAMRLVGGAFVLLAVMNFMLLALLMTSGPGGSLKTYAPPVWSSLKTSETPLVFVLGDYYIYGEFRDGLFLERLVRDFEVNNKDDLDSRRVGDPERYGRAQDVSLQYLPVSVAHVMEDLSGIVSDREPWVLQASALTPETIKCCDIVYIGLTSGMGILEENVFAGARFVTGETFDQIIDTSDDREFVSEAFLNASEQVRYRDYALFSFIPGDRGNHVRVLAGTRDTGLMGLSENLQNADWVRETLTGFNGVDRYEALFEITGQSQVNLSIRLVRQTGAE